MCVCVCVCVCDSVLLPPAVKWKWVCCSVVDPQTVVCFFLSLASSFSCSLAVLASCHSPDRLIDRTCCWSNMFPSLTLTPPPRHLHPLCPPPTTFFSSFFFLVCERDLGDVSVLDSSAAFQLSPLSSFTAEVCIPAAFIRVFFCIVGRAKLLVSHCFANLSEG